MVYLHENKGEFSFKTLSIYIVQTAIKENKVKNAAYTQYSSHEMNPLSSITLSKIIWELIWEKKIFIAFGDNPYTAHYAGDTRFVSMK